tara:strand:- start:2828 stop:3367 length:540 start_codon:yes stop_codon:yes gene_type:complete
MDPTPPNCDYETYTIHVQSPTEAEIIAGASGSDFKVNLQTPLKDIVEFSLISCTIPSPRVPGSEVVYISIPEVQSNFTDYLEPVANDTGTSSLLRNAFGCVYQTYSGATVDARIIYRNEYPMKTRFIYPLERLESISIKLYTELAAPVGTTSPASHPGFYTFQIKCMRKNLCNFNICTN